MCGIVGVIGKEETTDLLLQGLEKLEYRGYDSAGIFVMNADKQSFHVREKGQIAHLRKKVSKEVQGTIGIGHTRWATHGQPSVANAHPHLSPDGRFALIHNGVIENFEEIKQEFLSQVSFTSETDTEVIVSLIAYFAEQAAIQTTKEALEAALSHLEGSYALALIDKEDPTRLYVAKNKSPLLIGIGNECHVICSDAMAMLQETTQFLALEDGDLAIISNTQIHIEDQTGTRVTRQPFAANLDCQEIEKGLYPHYMLKEMEEQPMVMRKMIEKYTTKQGEVNLPTALLTQMKAADRLYIIACGTSYHAGLIGKRCIEEFAQIPVEVHLASEFSYYPPLLSERPFFIFLSQSGETADSRQVLLQVNQLGHPTLTITNTIGATLAREATYALPLHAGAEIAVASTKAYTAQVALLLLLAKALGEANGQAKACTLDIVRELSLVASVMETILAHKEDFAQIVDHYLAETRNAFYIGRGMDYAVSLEAALKLKEISYIQAEGFASGELKHGTIALIEAGTPVFGLITDLRTAAQVRSNLKEVESRGANTCVLVLASLAKAGDQWQIPEVHPAFTPLVSVLPTQLIAYYATVKRGLDVDKPRNLAKSVTVE